MPQVPFRARLRYALDNALARGVSTIALWLGMLALAIVVVAGLVIAVFGIDVEGRQPGFVEGAWLSLQRTLDAGTGGGDVGWPFRIVSLFVTLGGIFVVTALIGLTANGIDRRLEALRRGRSVVVETGHTLILGWSPKLPTILSELAIANANQRRAAVVILAATDKEEMDGAVRRWVPRGGSTHVVCRTGSPYSLHDLAMVRPESARSVIVLATDDDVEGAYTLKTVLALLSAGLRDGAPLVVEVHDGRRARALAAATGGRVLPVVSSEIIARITAQVCRQSGLSSVYQDLLDFDGDEIYFGADPRLAGMAFRDVLLAYEDSAVIGVRGADGTVRLVPPLDTVLAEGDEVVAISRDDDTVVFSGVARTGAVPTDPPSPRPPRAEHVLVLGWNGMGPHLLRELDAYAVPGSTVTVVAEAALAEVELPVGSAGGLDVRVVEGDTNDEELLARLVAERRPDHAIVLCYHSLPVAAADSRTLLTLLELRHLFATEGGRVPSVVAELLDVDDVALAPVTAADDFVVSEKITSYVLTQLSENAALAQVFDELLAAGGCEIAIRRLVDFLPPGKATFADVVARLAGCGEVAIGYRSRPVNGRAAGVVLNPRKGAALTVSESTEVITLNRPAPSPPALPKRRRARKAA